MPITVPRKHWQEQKKERNIFMTKPGDSPASKTSELREELDRVKKENNDLYNKIADLIEVAKSKDYFHDPDYKFLVEENRKLEEERNELLMDNKKLAQQVEDKMNQLRKSGM